MTGQQANALIADWLRATLKPGDRVFLWTGASIVIKRVNRKGVTSHPAGVRWSYDEITPANAAGEMMTPEESTKAFLAWRQQQN